MRALAPGLVVLAAAWLAPRPHGAEHAFSVHMATHMAVVAVAAPLIALGTAGSRFDPARRWPALFPPVPASLVELVVVWTWHAPVLHHAARQSWAGLAAEQGSFLLSGLIVWWAALGGSRSRQRAGAGVLALLLTSMHMTLLGALLALTPRPLFGHGAAGLGLTRLEDQHLGGAIMILVGGLSYFTGGLWLSARLLEKRPRERDRAAGHAEPAASRVRP